MTSRRRQHRIQKNDAARIEEAVHALIHSIDGRRFLWWLLDLTHVLNNAFDAESDRLTTFRLGEQNVGLQLLELIEKVDADAWVKLRQEHLDFLKQFEEPEDENE